MAQRIYDDAPGWLARKVEKLDRDLRELASAKRLAGSSLGSGSSLSILGTLKVVGSALVTGSLDLTGTLSMKTTTGAEQVRLGSMLHGDRGVTMRRDNGALALEIRKLSAGEFVGQSVVIYDSAPTSVLSTEDLFGGLRQPYLEHPFQPVAAVSGTAVTCGPYGLERTTTSAVFETLFVHDGVRQNPHLNLKVAAVCSDGTTAGELRAVNVATGVQLPAFIDAQWNGVIAAGTTTYTVYDPGALATSLNGIAVHAAMRIGIQARRTAGAGTITVAVPSSTGG